MFGWKEQIARQWLKKERLFVSHKKSGESQGWGGSSLDTLPAACSR